MLEKNKRIVNRDLIDWIKENVPCVACGTHMADECDHVQTRGAGGDDVPENLLPLCRGVHSLRHFRGLNYIANNYPGVKEWLKQAGWGYDKKRGCWRHKNSRR